MANKKMKSLRIDEQSQNILDKILQQYNYNSETAIIIQAIKDIGERLLTDDELKSCLKINKI